MRAIILGVFLSLAGCADLEVESATPASDTAASTAAGTACGPNGLICSKNQTCCVTDPLPPAPPRYTCIAKNQACNP